MEKSKIKYLIIIGFLSLASLYAFFVYKPKTSAEMAKTAEILKTFPKKVGEWVATEEIQIDQANIAALEPSSLVFRKYENKNRDALWLCIVYHQNDRWGAHDPQVCYRSQGWNLYDYGGKYETTSIYLGGLDHKINRFYVEKQGVKEMVLYWWFGSREKQMASRFDQMLNMVYTGIFHGYIESGFVRVSLPLGVEKEEKDIANAIDFAKEVSKAIRKYLPK